MLEPCEINERCERKFDRILEHQDETKEAIIKIKEILVEQHLSLKEHISRTELLEQRMTLIEEFVVPIRKHILLINTAFKIISFTVAGYIALRQAGMVDWLKNLF